MRREVSAAEPCGPALWRNVLSLVPKSRNSSGGIYRCHGPSAHDWRRTKAMRFLMNTLLAHPIPALDACVPANPLWIRSGSRRCLRVLYEAPNSRHPSLLAWRNYSSQSLGASSILLLKAAGKTYMHPKSLPASICTPSQRVLFPDSPATSGVGFLQPSRLCVMKSRVD